jgi:hypothetical protein
MLQTAWKFSTKFKANGPCRSGLGLVCCRWRDKPLNYYLGRYCDKPLNIVDRHCCILHLLQRPRRVFGLVLGRYCDKPLDIVDSLHPVLRLMHPPRRTYPIRLNPHQHFSRRPAKLELCVPQIQKHTL